VTPERIVSAIIPTYNNADMVVEAVRSVQAQTWPAMEIIVVDDGSDDDTLTRLSEFGDAVKVIQQENLGPAFARNAGIRASTGEIIAFLDSDDLWMPEKIEQCVAALDANPDAGVVYTAVYWHEMDSGLEYVLPQYTMSGWMARDLFLECHGVCTSALVVRRSCFEKTGYFDEDFFRAQDWDLMIRLAEDFQYTHVDKPLTEMRRHRGNLSTTHRDLYAKYNLMVLENALKRRPDLYEELKADSFARAYFRFGMLLYSDFKMREARAQFKRSLAYQWDFRTLNYIVRSLLPVALVRKLRQVRLAFVPAAHGEKTDV